MDVKLIFRETAKKLLSDFNISAQIKHPGVTGTYREDSLKRFLIDGRLPSKYGIGSGEIIGPNSNISRQSDMVIYDKENCPVIVFSESVQVFPSESVYGVIEVKSKLSKQKLIEGLENIAAFKQLVPEGQISQRNVFMTMNYERPRPFGIIFAYSLSGNSLDSLVENLREYEARTPEDLWPNMVVVLNEGIIWHNNGKLKTLIKSECFNNETYPINIHFKQDTLFEFYITLLELLSSIKLGDFELRKYKELPRKVGNHFVVGHDRFINRQLGTVSSLNERFVNRVYEYCQEKGTVTYKDILLSEIGQLPIGVDEGDVINKLYYYNPDNFPGYHEVENPFIRTKEGFVETSQKLAIPGFTITIDDEPYHFPQAYIEPDDLEVIPNLRPEDL